MNAALLPQGLVGQPCAARQAWREGRYRETLTLRDGRQVLLRPAHHRDADALARFFSALSPQSRLLRFHGAVNRLPERVLSYLSTQVPDRHVALVALARTDDGTAQLLAEARYAVGDDGQPEFAVAVADAWQRQGLGRALVQRLAAHARAEGVPLLHGAVVPGNEPMLRLMDSLGAELQGHAPEVMVRLAL